MDAFLRSTRKLAKKVISCTKRFASRDCVVTYSGEVTEGTLVGTIESGSPFYEGEDKEVAEAMAKAWLIDNNLETVYLAEDGIVERYIRNDGVDEWMEKYSKYSAVYIAHIILFATYVFAGLWHNPGWIGISALVVISALYQLIWRSKFLNEIESAVLCEIMLLLCLILIPTVQEILQKTG